MDFGIPLDVSVILLLVLIALGAGLIDTIAGGGGLVTIPALLFVGIPPHIALGTNRLQATIGELTAVLAFIRQGKVNYRFLYRGIFYTILGSVIGTWLVSFVNAEVLAVLLPMLLIAVALYSLLSHRLLGQDDKPAKISNNWFMLIGGLGIGFYNGFFGPGTGSIWMLAFVILLGQGVALASMNTKPLNFVGNLISLGIFLYLAKVHFVLGCLMGLGQIVGALIGSKIVIKGGNVLVKPVFLVMVTVLAIVTAINFGAGAGINHF